MPIRVECRECGRQINAPDKLAGRKAKCPQCQTILTIPAAEPVDAIAPAPKAGTLPKRRAAEPEARITSKPQPRDEPEPDEEVVVERAAKKPKRKKKRRPERRLSEKQGMPPWALWLIIVGTFILLAGSIAIGAAFKGHAHEVLIYSVILAVMVPLSTVILIISMFISSWLGGGIDFGDARVVIPKAVGLLLLVNMIGLLPMGSYLALPFWLFGLMFLFNLDLWETRILMVVNWALNFGARMLVFLIIFAIFTHAGDSRSPKSKSGQQPEASKETQAILAIAEAGGECIPENEDDEDSPVVVVNLAGRQVNDAVLAQLKNFPKLRSLDLSGSSITDDGMAHLEGLTSLRTLNLSRTAISDAGLVHLRTLNQLQTLSLTGSRATNAGVADLQKALPGMRIVP